MSNKEYDEKQDSRNCLWKKVNIYRHDGALYIKRLIIIRLGWFSIMLHRIYLSDTDCMHDHPWAFTTFMLRGSYLEYTPHGNRWYHAPNVMYRPAEYIHRLEVDESKPPVITLVFTGPQIRKWGFWTMKGWLPWKQYTNNGRCDV